jgi:hypothetical protein
VPVALARVAASGDACTPAAQIFVRAVIVSTPFGPLTVIDRVSMPVAVVPSRT